MKKVIISGMIGNALEWYDYALYVQFAHIIGMHFFPNSEITEILTYAVFAAGFLVRPVGGVVFGQIGDKFGRRVALAVGILCMAVPTAGIGLLPGYNYIGWLAPAILVVLRLIQGFALGGEFSSCITYIVEFAPPRYRGISGSAAFVSMCLGILLGLLTSRGFYYFMDPEILVSWGWRLPFVGGLFIGVIGFYIRKNLSESPLYKAAKEAGKLSRHPLRETVTTYWREMLIAIGLYINVTAPFYTTTVFIKDHMGKMGHDTTTIFNIDLAMLSVLIIGFPISAGISDRIGRKPVLLVGILAMFFLAYPLFIGLSSPNYTMVLLSSIIFSSIVALYMGPIPTILIEIFPTRARFIGVALSYNLSTAIFGGTTPMIGRIFEKYTGNPLSIAYYLMLMSIATLVSFCFYKESYRKNIAEDRVYT